VKDSFEVPYGATSPGVFFPQVAQRYMHEFGLTREQLNRQLGAVAVNQRRNAIMNGNGSEKKPLTYVDYLNSPVVADPLRLADYCRWCDGACAWIITSAERAKYFPNVPVYVTGLGYNSNPMNDADYWTQRGKNYDYIHKPHMAVALDRALQMAGIFRDDLDFAMIYDAFTIMLLVFFESLGFCKYGEGGAFAESGGMSLEGAMPVNTHGGHLSHSYQSMASHMVESVKQLRGEAGACQIKNAKFGMLEGGSPWEEYVTILRRD
jgi:acetyl-CoA acetyltransferase